MIEGNSNFYDNIYYKKMNIYFTYLEMSRKTKILIMKIGKLLKSVKKLIV